MRGTSEGKPELVHHADYWGFVQDARWHNTDMHYHGISGGSLRQHEENLFSVVPKLFGTLKD
jgi:hypothetical protein